MASHEREYQRLPGVGIRREGVLSVGATRSSLWLGKDHLLCRELQGFEESYKRFYYKDIEAVITHKTDRGQIWNILWATLTFVLGLIGWAVKDSVGTITLWILAGLCLLGLLINTIWGATCACFLRTAVQTEELPSLNRLRRVRKTMQRLRPLIETAQGTLTPEEAQAQLQATLLTAPQIDASTFTAGQGFNTFNKQAAIIHHCAGRYHGWLFFCLLSDGLLATIYLLHAYPAHSWLNAFVTLVEVILLIGALVQQNNSDISQNLRRVMRLVMIAYGGLFFASIIYGFVLSGTSSSPLPMTISPWDDRGMLALMIASIICCFTLGFWGLSALSRFRSAYEATQTVEPENPAGPQIP